MIGNNHLGLKHERPEAKRMASYLFWQLSHIKGHGLSDAEYEMHIQLALGLPNELKELNGMTDEWIEKRREDLRKS